MPLSSLRSPRPATARDDPPAPGGGRRGSALFLAVILTAQLMVVLDTTIVNVALPHIQRGLAFSGTGLSWVINAYILTFGGLLLLGARAGDLVGRRRVFLGGIALFSVSSLAGGFAVTGWMLLGSRALQGVGAALAAPTALSLLTAVFPEGPQRVRAIALYTTVSAAGGATGLVAGGLLTELVSWRWVMFVNVPIGLAVLALGRRVLAETERRHGHHDVSGAVTSTAGTTAVVFGLVQAGSGGWGSPLAISAFAVGLVLLGLFVLTEAHAEEPILPLRLFAHGTRTTANVARGLIYAGMYGMFFYMSQFFQDVQGFSPLRAGVAFLPMPASVFLASQLTSRVLVRRIPEKALMVTGALFAAVSLGLATRIGAGSSYGQIVVTIVLLGLGSGISFVSLTSASLAEVEPRDAGAASGLINVTQQLGAALGLAVLVTVFDAATRHVQLGGRVAAGAVAHAHQVVVHGVDDVFAVGIGFTVAALVLIGTFVRTPPPQPAGLEVGDDDAERGAEGPWLAEVAEAG
ncbi:MAG TPA: MFS transporter [Acidimicrobiales bacterium]|nr:MFS transporter [Acidimicrobiales bacterium]